LNGIDELIPVYHSVGALDTQLLCSPGRGKMPLNENLVYEAKLKLLKFIAIEGPIRKN
jgi:hypothetical protein